MLLRILIGIFLLTLPAHAAESWTRLCNGSLTATLPSENANVDEPNVIVEGGLIKMWYDAGGTISAVHYATAPIPAPGACPVWTKFGRILGQGVGGWAGHASQTNVIKINGVYEITFAGPNGIYLAESVDGTTITKISPTPFIPSNPSFDAHNVNSYIVPQGTGYVIFYNSADLNYDAWFQTRAVMDALYAWKDPRGAMTSLRIGTGMYSIRSGVFDGAGTFQAWGHQSTVGNLPTDIYHSSTADLFTWSHCNSSKPVITHNAPTWDQAADPYVVDINGVGYMFFSEMNNSANPLKGQISIAVSALPLESIGCTP